MVFLIAAAALMIALLTGALIEPPPANQHGQRFDPCALSGLNAQTINKKSVT
jgi:hypothetical protein